MSADITIEPPATTTRRHGAVGDIVFRTLTQLFALLVLLVLGGVALSQRARAVSARTMAVEVAP